MRLAVAMVGALIVLAAVPAGASVPQDKTSVIPIHQRLHGGFVGRLNFASLAIDEIPDDYQVTMNAFSAGGFLISPISREAAVQLELVYTRKGGKVRVPLEEVVLTDTLRVDYLEFAPLLQAAVPMPSEVRVFVEAGPVLGLRLAAELESKASNLIATESVTTDVTDDVAPFEFGLAIGCGVAVPVGNAGVLFGLRYHFGLTNLSESYADATGAEPYSRNLQLQTGVYF